MEAAILKSINPNDLNRAQVLKYRKTSEICTRKTSFEKNKK